MGVSSGRRRLALLSLGGSSRSSFSLKHDAWQQTFIFDIRACHRTFVKFQIANIHFVKMLVGEALVGAFLGHC